MNKLSKYICMNLLQSTFYSILALITLYGIFEILIEGNELVKTSESFILTFKYVLIRIPVYFYEMAPIAILIGSIIALTRLVINHEYVVMITSGLSLLKLTRVVLIFGLFMGILIALLGEIIVPQSEKITDQIIAKTKIENVSMLGKYNVWLKLDDEIIELWEVLPDYSFKKVLRYKLIDNKKLAYIKYSQTGEYLGHNTWKLRDVSTVSFKGNQVISHHFDFETWNPSLNLELLNILVNKPKNMSVTSLNQYIHYLKKNHQKTINYKIEMWKKIFYPFSALVMVLIALIFTPIISRYTNIGLKIILGLLAGMVYFVMIRFFSFFTQILAVNPIGLTALPTFFFILLSGVVLYYKNKGYKII